MGGRCEKRVCDEGMIRLTSNSSRAASFVTCTTRFTWLAIVNWSWSEARKNWQREERISASCKAARDASTRPWAREQRLMEDSECFALRNQVVRSAAALVVGEKVRLSKESWAVWGFEAMGR